MTPDVAVDADLIAKRTHCLITEMKGTDKPTGKTNAIDRRDH